MAQKARAAVRVKGRSGAADGVERISDDIVPFFGWAPLAQPSLRGRYALTSHS